MRNGRSSLRIPAAIALVVLAVTLAGLLYSYLRYRAQYAATYRAVYDVSWGKGARDMEIVYWAWFEPVTEKRKERRMGVKLGEKVKDGIKVAIKGKAKSEEVITDAALKESIGKAAVAYVEKFIGDRATVGNKAGSLGNRIRAALKAK